MSSPQDNPKARALFEEFLATREAGEDVSIDALCARHPHFADAFRDLWALHIIDVAVPVGGPTFFSSDDSSGEPLPFGVVPGMILDDFRLDRAIGHGAMGQVWEAEQLSLQRRVAVKLVRPDRVTPKTLDFFSREARAGGRLHHPGIVTVYAHGETQGIAWIAMEIVEGAWTLGHFHERVKSWNKLPKGYHRDVARIGAELADALQAAHEAGVIHRDLKPRNILITPDDHPKVGDFGLARIVDESALSDTGDFAGTYAYMSPEQAAAKRIGIDHRTDVFSLGVVLYELVALRRPFEGDTKQVCRKILLEDPTDPRKIRSDVPRDLAVIVTKCLEKQPDRRYPTMTAMAADLRRYLQGEPIFARLPSRARKMWHWAKREPRKSIPAAGVLLLSLALWGAFALSLHSPRSASGRS